MPDEGFLEWYRVDPSRSIQRVLATGAAGVTLGAVIASVSFLTRQPDPVRYATAAVGILCVVGGAVSAVLGMYRVFRDDAYVGVRTDGIVLKLAAEATFLPWAEVERVRYDRERHAVVFERREGGEVVADKTFAGTGSADLAVRLDGLRRKAAWNLLPAERSAAQASPRVLR